MAVRGSASSPTRGEDEARSLVHQPQAGEDRNAEQGDNGDPAQDVATAGAGASSFALDNEAALPIVHSAPYSDSNRLLKLT